MVNMSFNEEFVTECLNFSCLPAETDKVTEIGQQWQRLWKSCFKLDNYEVFGQIYAQIFLRKECR